VADVFISYKREDRAWAEAASAKLVEAGLSTWWDTSLVAGERFSDVIGRELTSAKAIVVLWSAASLTSNWVKAEAQYAFDSDKIIAARIEDVTPGFPFQSIQTCDLIATQPRFAALLDPRVVTAAKDHSGRHIHPFGGLLDGKPAPAMLQAG